MRKLGYVHGQSAVIAIKYGTPEELPNLVAGLILDNMHVIACGSSACVRAAISATRTVPLVGVDLETDPIASGFAASLARPGGNLTGFFLDLPAFSAKRLEVLKETLPSLSRVLVLWDSSLDPAPLTGLESGAKALRLRLVIREVENESALAEAFEAGVNDKVGAVLVMQSPRLDGSRATILKLGASKRLPIAALFGNFVMEGGLLSYGPNAEELTRRTAEYIDKIIKGASPGDLPIQRPDKFDFVLNMRTARQLNLKIPESVLTRADHVIT
jgi:putative ABC transport system substrate-binding protein